MLSALALCAAFCFAAPPQDLAALQERLAKEAAPLEGMLKELEAMSRSYAGDPAPAPRDGLRSRVAAGRESIAKMLAEYRDLLESYQAEKQIALVSRTLKGAGGPPASQDVARLVEFGDRMETLVQLADVDLQADRVAFETLRPMLPRFMPAAVAAAFLVLLAFILFSRGREGPVVQEAPLATPAPRPAAAALPPPSRALGGNFRIVRELGKGSLGTAFEAMELTTGRKVVVKRLAEEFHRSDKELDRLLAAARRVTALKHPNLAELLSVFIDEDRVHLALEYVPGESVAERLRREGPFSVDAVKHLLWQSACALDFAHAEGFLHGDLKPSDIRIGPDRLVKLCDLGIGLEIRRMAAAYSWSETAGGSSYMAPEQELGEALQASDIYSLGAVLYEMLAGRPPFPGPDFLAQKRLMSWAPAGKLEPVLRKALDPDPRARFRTAEELVDAFEEAA